MFTATQSASFHSSDQGLAKVRSCVGKWNALQCVDPCKSYQFHAWDTFDASLRPCECKRYHSANIVLRFATIAVGFWRSTYLHGRQRWVRNFLHYPYSFSFSWDRPNSTPQSRDATHLRRLEDLRQLVGILDTIWHLWHRVNMGD